LLLLLLAMNVQAEEKAVYVGEERYACEGDSVECVVLKQRNRERRYAKDHDLYVLEHAAKVEKRGLWADSTTLEVAKK
jgi:hypothetical protein